MKLFKSTRCRLPTMLLAVVVVAATAYSIQEWLRLRDAREQFASEWDNWNAAHATSENVVLTSARLMKAEAASPWISEQAARQQHLARLNKLLADIETPMEDAAPERIERQANFVRDAIDKLDSSPTRVVDP